MGINKWVVTVGCMCWRINFWVLSRLSWKVFNVWVLRINKILIDRYLLFRLKSLFIINGLAILSGAFSIVSVSLKAIGPFLVGRFINGIMCGLFGCVATIYLTEIAPRNLRGAIGTFHQLALVIGMLVTNICGLPQFLGSDTLWPYLYVATAVPVIFHVCFLPFCMETPKYMYINKKNPNEAENSTFLYQNIQYRESLVYFFFRSIESVARYR